MIDHIYTNRDYIYIYLKSTSPFQREENGHLKQKVIISKPMKVAECG